MNHLEGEVGQEEGRGAGAPIGRGHDEEAGGDADEAEGDGPEG